MRIVRGKKEITRKNADCAANAPIWLWFMILKKTAVFSVRFLNLVIVVTYQIIDSGDDIVNNFWKTNKIILRETVKDDIDLFVDEHGNYDTDMMQKYDYIDFPRSKEHLSNSITKVNGDNSTDDFAFTIETLNGEKAGYLVTFDCDKRNGTFKYGIFVKEKFKGRKIAADAVNIVLDYYFNELRYNKVNVYIYDYNIPSIKFHEKLGFELEGRLRQMSYSNGKYHDTLYYGMLKSEFSKPTF